MMHCCFLDIYHDTTNGYDDSFRMLGLVNLVNILM